MSFPENHAERMERAWLSLEGLAIGDAFGEMLAYGCEQARERIDRGLIGGPWFHTDDTEMALSIYETLRVRGRIDPDELALRFAERFRRDPDRGYGSMAREILCKILSGVPWQVAARTAFGGTGSMGNGSAMRVAPLGAYFAEDLETCLHGEAALSAGVTHAHREGIAGAIGNGGQVTVPDTVPDTVPFVVWSAARRLDNYREALIDTVTGDGDCDTNCAMVGGIVALYAGRDAIPLEWLEARERFDFEPATPAR
jgi:ADP-ribosylglycohydrolase